MRVLMVEDEVRLAEALGQIMAEHRYLADLVYTGPDGLEYGLTNQYDVIVLDVMLPGMDGLAVARGLREAKVSTPILVLTARDEVPDKVAGLDHGADDYMTKPFNPQELAARVRSQLRRYTLLGDVHAEEWQGLIVNGRLTYDPDRRELRADGEAVKLTATETKIVDLLMRNLGRIFPAEEIYRRVWEGECYAPENTVMVHIRRIREKIELNARQPEYLKVVWGIGYKMEKKT